MKIMKAAVVLLLGMLLITAFACGGGGSWQGSTPTPAPAWTTYSNSSSGIIMQYPQDWVKFEGKTFIVMFVSPETAASVPHGAVFVSVIEELDPVTLSDYVDECILGMTVSFQNFNLSESSATTLAGIPAHKFVYTVEASNESHMKIMEIHSIKNNTDYIITYMVEESAYPNYLETAQQMIDSFRFD